MIQIIDAMLMAIEMKKTVVSLVLSQETVVHAQIRWLRKF